jgi:hypothetical protein
MPTIDLPDAGGHEAEIDEVFRRILAAGATLDQVEIACLTCTWRWCGRGHSGTAGP